MCICCAPTLRHKVIVDQKVKVDVLNRHANNLVLMAQSIGPAKYRDMYKQLVERTNICQGNDDYIRKCMEFKVQIDNEGIFKDYWAATNHRSQILYLNPRCFGRPLYLITTMLHELKHIVANIQEMKKPDFSNCERKFWLRKHEKEAKLRAMIKEEIKDANRRIEIIRRTGKAYE